MRLHNRVFLGMITVLGTFVVIQSSLIRTSKSFNFFEQSPVQQQTEVPLTIKHFDEQTFVSAVQLHPKKTDTGIAFRGGVVPHHLLVSREIAQFFQRISAVQPTVVIILGPNHSERGDGTPLSTLKSWRYPFGVIQAERTHITQLTTQGLVKLSDDALEEDHSISALLPFLHHYAPTATIVPILLSQKTTLRETEKLSQAFTAILREDPRSILISSVDFSHGLGESAGFKKDARTVSLIQTKDYQTLLSLDSTYLDSPESLVILLQSMEALGKTQQELFFRGSSAQKTGQSGAPGTTYFSMGWY